MKKVIAGIVIAAAAILMFYQGIDRLTESPSASDTLAVARTQPTKVRLRLKWVHQGQFAGFYAAQKNGYYRDEKLDVAIVPGGQDMNAVRDVASGGSEFGVWGAEQLMIARSNDIMLTAIGVVYQETAACFLTRTEDNIGTFKNIEGKTVGVQYGTDLETIYRALLRINNVDRTRIHEKQVSYNFPLFLNGEVDVWPSYSVNEPYVAAQRGVDTHILYPKDNGLHFYGDAIFCRTDFLSKNNDIVARFLRATVKGWRWALDNPQQAGKLCLEFDGTLDLDHQVHMIETSAPLIRPNAEGLLRMNDSSWLSIHGVLKKQNLLSRDVSVSEIYTNEFLPK